MTGVAWGNYQDYLYERFDGKRHVDEAQTDRWGNVISHGVMSSTLPRRAQQHPARRAEPRRDGHEPG